VREVAVRFFGGELVVSADGVERLRHRLDSMVSAPAEWECRRFM
jgi:hypothetical protein